MNLDQAFTYTEIAAAKKPLIFDAYGDAVDSIDDIAGLFYYTFNEWGDLIKKKKKAKHSSSFVAKLAGSLAGAMITGYALAGKYSGKTPDQIYRLKAKNAASARALEVERTTLKTTKKLMQGDGSYFNSQDRADRVARYEASKMFYSGMTDALKGTSMKKQWITTSENPCQACEDAEDEGPISVQLPFGHGEMAPALHLNCSCYLEIS